MVLRYRYVCPDFFPFLVLRRLTAKILAYHLPCLSDMSPELGINPLREVCTELVEAIPGVAELKQFPCDYLGMQAKQAPLYQMSIEE